MANPEISNPDVAAIFAVYPKAIRERLLKVRKLVLAVGKRVDPIGRVEESVKWGEPSYSTISGSPVRLGWNENDPEKYAIYFHCQTKLVETFRALYPKTFTFGGNRAIVFRRLDRVPLKELEACIQLALTYHKVKSESLLGAGK